MTTAACPSSGNLGDPVSVPHNNVVNLILLPTGGDADEIAWQDRALCNQTDPEAFYPEKGGSTREAKQVCKSCEVREQCLQYALDHDERFGIWGGLSRTERRQLNQEKSA